MLNNQIDIVCCINDLDSRQVNWDQQNKKKFFNGRYLDFVTQFLILYNSIKNNWKFNYKIYLFYNFLSEDNLKKLSLLDINLIHTESTINNPYILRQETYKYKTQGTHKLYLDVDTIATKNPNFDLSKDFLIMPCNHTLISQNDWNNIATDIDHPIKDWKYGGGILDLLWSKQKTKEEIVNLNYFPHFNGGAILMKNNLSEEFGNLFIRHLNKVADKKMGFLGALMISEGLAITKLTNNWSIFDLGFNYFEQAQFGVPEKYFNISKIFLYHYINDNNLHKFKNFINTEIFNDKNTL